MKIKTHVICATLLLMVVGAGNPIASAAEPMVAMDAGGTKSTYAIVIHGGCGKASRLLPQKIQDDYLRSLRAAVSVGQQMLANGKASLDVVEHVARMMEDDPRFNAGRGSTFNKHGHHELDASIMDGRTMECGAVAGLTTTRNPISVARLVMEQSGQVLLAGRGADQFAQRMQAAQVAPDYFYTPRLRELWKSVQHGGSAEVGRLEIGLRRGTIGVVALDMHGNLAAATSTGGRFLKPAGRVGDSPIIGAGTYASNKSCAVSCTGAGEEFIRHSVAKSVAARMELAGESLDAAAHHTIHETLQPGMGGLIAVARDGSVTMQFNTRAMLRGVATSAGRFEVKIWE